MNPGGRRDTTKINFCVTPHFKCLINHNLKTGQVVGQPVSTANRAKRGPRAHTPNLHRTRPVRHHVRQ